MILIQTHKTVCNNNADLAQALQEHQDTPMGLMDRFLLPDGMSMYELDQRLEKWVKFHNAMLMWATIHALGIPTSLANARAMVLYIKLKPTNESFHRGSAAKGFKMKEAYALPIAEAKKYKSPWPESLEQLELMQSQSETRGQGRVCACMIECPPLAVQTVPFGGLKNLGIPGSIPTWKATLEEHFDQGKKMSITR